MGCTVKELLSRIDSRELAEWYGFWQLEPWGDSRADLRAGIVASTIANANRGKDTKPFRPIDFMPYAEDNKAEKQTDSKTNVAVFKAMFAHKVKRNG